MLKYWFNASQNAITFAAGSAGSQANSPYGQLDARGSVGFGRPNSISKLLDVNRATFSGASDRPDLPQLKVGELNWLHGAGGASRSAATSWR